MAKKQSSKKSKEGDNQPEAQPVQVRRRAPRRPAQPQTSPYQDFINKRDAFIQYSNAVEEIYEVNGDPSSKLRDLAAITLDEPFFQNDMRTNASKEALAEVFDEESKYRKEDATKFSNDNLEAILSDSKYPEEDIKIGIKYVIEPKSEYTGNHATVYKKVAKLHKEFKEMSKTSPSERQVKIKEFYEHRYQGDDDENKHNLNIVNRLMKADRTYAQKFYNYQIQEKSTQMDRELKGHEVGYLTENLKGKDFLEYDRDLQTIKEELAKMQTSMGR